MEGSLKKKVAKGSAWVLLEQCCCQGLNFFMGVVLARLLTPSDYGTVALVTIFITVATVLVNSGLGQALVQRQDVTDVDFDSVFYVSLAMACGLYAVLFFAAPFVADYYAVPELSAILRVLAVNLIFYAVNSVQSAELYKRMRFDVSFRISLVTVVTSAAVGIGLAAAGQGVWALVYSSVLANLAGVVARWCFIAWRPHLRFSLERIVPLFRFGWKMMVSSLIGTVVTQLYGIVTTRYYKPADLGFLNKGRNIPDLIRNAIQVSMIEATFPAIVQLKDDRDRYVFALRRLLVVSTFVVFPLMMFLAAVSEKLILFLYGGQWVTCVPYAQLTCLAAVFMTVTAVNEIGITAIGRSDIFLKVNIFRCALSVGLLFWLLPRGIMLWMLATAFFYAPLSVAVEMTVNRRLLRLPILTQLRDVLPTAVISGSVGLLLYLIGQAFTGSSAIELFACLAVQGIVAAVLYLGLAAWFRLRGLRELVQLLAPKVEARMPAFRRLSEYLGEDR